MCLICNHSRHRRIRDRKRFFLRRRRPGKKIPTTKRFNNKHKTTNRTLRRTRIPVDVGNFGGVIRIGVFDPEGIFDVLGIERGYCTSGVRVSPAVFGVECRVYCCDNRRRFAGCVED